MREGTNSNQEDVVTRIPDPQTVRVQLARHLREAGVLRRLLKVAEFAARELGNRQTAK